MSLAKIPLSAGILCRGHRALQMVAEAMDLRCLNCNSRDLKKVSLAYQEGLSRVTTRSRLGGFLVGEAGPAIVTGMSVERGIRQTDLSKSLSPPLKWSYIRLVVRFFLLTCAAFFAYVIFVAASTPPVSTLPMKLYVFSSPVVFLFFSFAIWRHNHVVYPRQYSAWDRSFICQWCGAVSQQSAGQ
jgi:hypothetical protein